MWYWPGKIYLVLDALSRLLGTVVADKSDILDDLSVNQPAAYSATLVEMSEDFR